MIKQLKMLKLWIWTRAMIIKEISEIHEILDKQVIEVAHQIEELDQQKVYFIKAPGYSKDELEHLMNFLKKATTKIKWTPPLIIVVNTEIEEMTEQDIEQLIKHQKKKRSVKK